MRSSSHTLLHKREPTTWDVTESILSNLAERDIEQERIEN